MELCNGRSCAGGHLEIVYDRGPCPLCMSRNEVMDLEDKIEELQRQLEERDIRDIS